MTTNITNSLPIALKQVIEEYGKDVLLKSVVINVLNDYNAFADIPQTKFILKCIISESIAERLLLYKSWNNDCEKIMNRFVQTTGFRTEFTEYVFKSLSYSFGWMDDFPTYEQLNNVFSSSVTTTSIPPLPRNKPIKNKPVEKMDEDEFEQYVWSIIEWDHNLEKKAGIELSNFFIRPYDSDYDSIVFLFEAKGKLKTDRFTLNYAAYDERGRLRDTGQLYYVCEQKDIKNQNSEWIYLHRSLNKITRIVISAEYD